MLEVEKKYKLSEEKYNEIANFIAVTYKVTSVSKKFEINTLFVGDITGDNVFRIRDIGSGDKVESTFTYKKRISNKDGLRIAKEIEFKVGWEFRELLLELGLTVGTIYKKKRIDVSVDPWFTISLDTLPYGRYLELEGLEDRIEEFEAALGLEDLVEPLSYPDLTEIHGEYVSGVMVSRFEEKD